MPLMENDFDVFGVLFDVRTQGLESVKGVIQGLNQASEEGKKFERTMFEVNQSFGTLAPTTKETLELIAKGGNQFAGFSNQARMAAKDVLRVGDEFEALLGKQRALRSSVAGMRAESPDDAVGHAARIKLQESELAIRTGQLEVIRQNLMRARDSAFEKETVSPSALSRVANELKARSTEVHNFSPQQQHAGQLSDIQRTMYEVLTSAAQQRQEILNKVSQSTFDTKYDVGRGARGQVDSYGRPITNRWGGYASGKGSDAASRDARDPNSFNVERAALEAQNAIDYHRMELTAAKAITGTWKEAEALVKQVETATANKSGIDPSSMAINRLSTQREAEAGMRALRQSMGDQTLDPQGVPASIKDRERKYKESIFERQRSQESIARAEAERYQHAMDFDARSREVQQKIANVVNQGLRQAYMDEHKLVDSNRMTGDQLNELMGRQIKPEHVAEPRTPEEARLVDEARSKMGRESPELTALRHGYEAKFAALAHDARETDELLRELPEGHPDREVLDKRRLANQQRRVQLYQDTEDEKRKIQLGPEVFNRVKAIEDLEQQSKTAGKLDKYLSYKKITADVNRYERSAEILTRTNPHDEASQEHKQFERRRAADQNKLDLEWAEALGESGHGRTASSLRRSVAQRQSLALDDERNEREAERKAAHQARLARIRGGAQSQVEATESAATNPQTKTSARELLREARNALNLGTAKGPLSFPAPYDEFGNPIPGGRRTPELISQDPEERLLSARADAREQIRRTMVFRGAASPDLGPNTSTQPDGPNAAYSRMMSAEARLADVQAKRQQNSGDYEAKINRLAELRVSTTDRIARAEERSTAKRVAFERIEQEVAQAVQQRSAAARETAEINEQKQIQTQEKLSIGNEKFLASKRKLESKDFSDLTGAGKTEAVRENLKAVETLQRQIDMTESLAAISERQYNHKRQLDKQATNGFLAEQETKLNAAEKAMNEEAAKATTYKDRQLGRLDRIQEEYTTRERRRNESLLNQEDQASRKVIDARVKYEYDSHKDLDRLFSRRSETLRETLMRTVESEGFPEARAAQEESARVAQLGVGPRAATSASETESRAYQQYARQVDQVNRALGRQRGKLVDVRESGMTRLALLQMHTNAVPEEFQDEAQRLLLANQIRLRERVGQRPTAATEGSPAAPGSGMLGALAESEAAAMSKVNQAHGVYVQNLKREQEAEAHANRGEVANSMFQMSMQLAVAAAAVKGLLVNMVEYAARTETMTVVTEQMARVNNINVDAVNNQVAAIKNLRITTQDAHETVQRMMFAELDLSKATELARVSQDAAVISGKNSSETLTNIITGIVTGQTRILHNMGLQVSMQQVLRQLRAELGREPTEVERRQAMLNAVLNEGVKIQGNYEAAMLTAGKQMLSLKRQFQEAENAIGHEFQPAFTGVLDLMARFSNFARENADSVAVFVRALGGLTAAFITLKTATMTHAILAGESGLFSQIGKLAGIKYVAEGGEEALAAGMGSRALGKVWSITPWGKRGLAAAGTAAEGVAAGEGALAAGEGAGIVGGAAEGGLVAVMSGWGAIVLGLTAAIGVLTYTLSGSSPMSGALGKISAIRNQQDLDIHTLEEQHLTGEIDDQGYKEAVSRFYNQNRMLFEKAKQEVADVWIDQARQSTLTVQQFSEDMKRVNDEGFLKYFTEIPLQMKTLWNTVTWPVKDNDFKRAGMTFGEYISGNLPGSSGDPEKARQTAFARIREQILAAGDQPTAAGPVSAQENAKRFDKWVTQYNRMSRGRDDSLLNTELMLEQESTNLTDRIQSDLTKSKNKLEALFVRLVDKTIVDPVEKVRAEMLAELSKEDIRNTENYKATIKDLRLLGMDSSQNSAAYAKYSQLRKADEALGITDHDKQALQMVLDARVEDRPDRVKFGKGPEISLEQAIRERGLGDVAAQMAQHVRYADQIKVFEEGSGAQYAKNASGEFVKTADEIARVPGLKQRYELEAQIKESDEAREKTAEAHKLLIAQETLLQDQKYAAKNSEFEISRAQMQVSPGVEAERGAIESTFQSKFQFEVAQGRQRRDQIREVIAEQIKLKQLQEGHQAQLELANRLNADLKTTNEKLLELDHARLLAQEQINQRLRQQALDIDVGRSEDQLKLTEAVFRAQMSGESQRLALAEKLRDLAVEEADAKFKIKNPGQTDSSHDAETIRSKDAANLTLELEKVAIAQSKVDKARSSAQSLIEFNFKKESELLKARAFGPLEEMSASRQTFELKKQQIEALADFQRKADGEKKDEAEIQAQRDRQMRDAELEFLTQRMNAAKKVREDNQKLGGDVFNALWGRAHGQMNAFHDLATNLVKNTGETLFKNLWNTTLNGPHGALSSAGKAFTLPGQGTIDHPTFLGRLLQGTALGLKDNPQADVDKYVRSHSMVADSNVALVGALERLRQTVEGKNSALKTAKEYADNLTKNPQYGGFSPANFPTVKGSSVPEPSFPVQEEEPPVVVPPAPAAGETPLSPQPAQPATRPISPKTTYRPGPPKFFDSDTLFPWKKIFDGLMPKPVPPANLPAEIPKAKPLDPNEQIQLDLSKYDQVMKGDAGGNWQQNTRLPGGGSYISANLRSWVGLRPDAYSKVGHVPLFTYKDPAAAEAGEYGWGDKGIRLNTAKMPDGTEGDILRHELTHKLMEPAIPAMAQDKELQAYFDKIRKGLISEHGDMYAGQDGKPLASQNVVTEALAYNVQKGKVPGLSSAESSTFINRAMMVAQRNKQGELVDLYDRLQKPDAGEFTMKADAPFKVNIPESAPGQKGSQLAFLNNNPGNLDFDPMNPAGAVPGTPHGKSNYAKFETPEAGYAAVEGYIKRHAARGLTLEQYAKKYAEDPTYGAKISQALGVPLGTPLSAIDTAKLAQFQIKQESSSSVMGVSPTDVFSRGIGREPIPSEVQQYVPGPGVAPYSIPGNNSAGNLKTGVGFASSMVRGAPGSIANDAVAGADAVAQVSTMLGHGGGSAELSDKAKTAEMGLRLGQSKGQPGFAGALNQGVGSLGMVVGGLKRNQQATFLKLRSMDPATMSPKQKEQLASLTEKITGKKAEMPVLPDTRPGYGADNSQKYSPENYDESGNFLGAGATSSSDPDVKKSGKHSAGGAAGAVGTGMEVASAGFMAYDAAKQFGKGGAQGALGGAQDILGMAAMIPGPQQPFIMAAAMGVGMVKSLLGDPREKYKKEIEKRLKQMKYNEPETISETLDTFGQRVDFDFLGRVRQGGMIQSGPMSTLTDVEYQNLLMANQGQQRSGSPLPGNLGLLGGIRYSDTTANTNSSGGNTPGPGNPVNLAINVNTMDSRSFNDNSNLIANAMRQQLLVNHPIVNDLRQISGA